MLAKTMENSVYFLLLHTSTPTESEKCTHSTLSTKLGQLADCFCQLAAGRKAGWHLTPGSWEVPGCCQ